MKNFAAEFNKRFGIKNGYTIKLINEPEEYSEVIALLDKPVKLQKKLHEPVDLIHLFTKSKKELSVEMPCLRKYIKDNGAIWISWPKKSSNFICDLDTLTVREIAVQNGLSDTDICSFDDAWFAMKLEQKNGGN